jgi:hypothetical protein
MYDPARDLNLFEVCLSFQILRNISSHGCRLLFDFCVRRPFSLSKSITRAFSGLSNSLVGQSRRMQYYFCCSVYTKWIGSSSYTTVSRIRIRFGHQSRGASEDNIWSIRPIDQETRHAQLPNKQRTRVSKIMLRDGGGPRNTLHKHRSMWAIFIRIGARAANAFCS